MNCDRFILAGLLMRTHVVLTGHTRGFGTRMPCQAGCAGKFVSERIKCVSKGQHVGSDVDECDFTSEVPGSLCPCLQRLASLLAHPKLLSVAQKAGSRHDCRFLVSQPQCALTGPQSLSTLWPANVLIHQLQRFTVVSRRYSASVRALTTSFGPCHFSRVPSFVFAKMDTRHCEAPSFTEQLYTPAVASSPDMSVASAQTR